MTDKTIWQSKTVWFNVVGLIAGGLAAWGIDVTPEQQATIVGGILTVVNIGNVVIRRYWTSKAIR